MNLLLWVVAWALAALFLMVGFVKLTRTREELLAQMEWVEEVKPRTIKIIGVLEILAAVALVIPPLLGVAVFLTPLAAAGIVFLMLGAGMLHQRRHENSMLLMNLIIAMMGTFVAVGRSSWEPF